MYTFYTFSLSPIVPLSILLFMWTYGVLPISSIVLEISDFRCVWHRHFCFKNVLYDVVRTAFHSGKSKIVSICHFNRCQVVCDKTTSTSHTQKGCTSYKWQLLSSLTIKINYCFIFHFKIWWCTPLVCVCLNGTRGIGYLFSVHRQYATVWHIHRNNRLDRPIGNCFRIVAFNRTTAHTNADSRLFFFCEQPTLRWHN